MTSPNPEAQPPAEATPPTEPVYPAPAAPAADTQPTAFAADTQPTQPTSPPAPVAEPVVPAQPAPPAVESTQVLPPAPAGQPYQQPGYPQATQPAATQPQGHPTQPTQPQGYPTQGYPTSGVPAQPGYPTSSIPAQPVASGVPYPTSAYPATGAPYAPGVPAPVPAKRGPAVLVLSIVVGFLVVALGVVGTLYALKVSDAGKQEKKLSAEVAAEQKSVADLKAQLTTTQAEVQKAKQDLEGAKAANAEKLKLLGACVDAVQKMIDSPTEAAFRKNFPAMVTTCEAADIAVS